MIKSIAKYLCSGVIILLHLQGFAQYSKAQLIEKIASFQIENDEFYNPGLFPTGRTWSFSSKPVKDNTIFFTASIVSTLRMIYSEVDADSRQQIDSIISRSSSLYPKYQSRNGEVTYNFWQTVAPDLPFPNGNRLISNERARLPDDFDTSVLIGLSQEKNDSLDALLRQRMTTYSGRENREDVKLYTRDEYKNLQAYETWFGKEMPQTFDICVMSNVLLYVFDRDFPLNTYDYATIDLINQMILNEDHLKRTTDVSHHSNSSALVLYHVARLISADPNGLFDDIKQKVIDDLVSLSNEVENEIEKVMIASSLNRLNVETSYSPDFVKLEEDVTSFSFFSINLFNISKGQSNFLPSVTWVCEAYNWTLYLEFLILQKK